MDRPRKRSGFRTGAALIVLLGVVFAAEKQSGGCPPAGEDSKADITLRRSKLLVGAYYLTDNLHDDKHVKEVADAGIDFLVAVNARKDVLDLCQEYQVGVIASSNIPMWWGDDGKRRGSTTKRCRLKNWTSSSRATSPTPRSGAITRSTSRM